jgi:hypothetical protein
MTSVDFVVTRLPRYPGKKQRVMSYSCKDQTKGNRRFNQPHKVLLRLSQRKGR